MPTLQVVGQVSEEGTIVIGSGFQVTRSSTGIYEVDYNPSLSTEPIVVLTGIAGGEDTVRTTTLYDSSVGGFRVSIENSAGTQRDAGFNFAAVLPDD